MKKWSTALGCLLTVALLSSCGYNRLQGLDEDVKAALSEVDNQYQRRNDLIPNLVEVVKGYAKHERETLEAVVKARAEATQTKLDVKDLSDPKAVQRFQEAQGSLTQALSRLLHQLLHIPVLQERLIMRELVQFGSGAGDDLAVQIFRAQAPIVARRVLDHQIAEFIVSDDLVRFKSCPTPGVFHDCDQFHAYRIPGLSRAVKRHT